MPSPLFLNKNFSISKSAFLQNAKKYYTDFIMENELKAALRKLSAEFLANSPEMSISGLWVRASKSAAFLARIDNGKSFTVRNFDKIVQWFSDNWPRGARWPAEVKRPPQSSIKQAAE